MDNKFKRSERKLVAKFKDEFDAEVKKNEGKIKFDAKRKLHVAIKPPTGFIAKAARHFYMMIILMLVEVLRRALLMLAITLLLSRKTSETFLKSWMEYRRLP